MSEREMLAYLPLHHSGSSVLIGRIIPHPYEGVDRKLKR